MGIGGKFWELLKPYAHHQGPDFLNQKRVAIDLCFWIVQHKTAIKSFVRKPHLRLTFFRTINLFSKFGAYPVFVVDGTPSPLKSRARISRFFRSSGIHSFDLPVPEDSVSVERNGVFLKCVDECVELLKLFGMPVLKANGEAEGLCAQLNREGLVDACVTSDSDAFLFGAKCVIKSIKPNSKEPFECYYMSDIEAGLGLKRNHLIAMALLVGNDHDLNGVQGIGVDTALDFVQNFHEDDILNGLREIGKGKTYMIRNLSSRVVETPVLEPLENSATLKTSHCSFCGHPGSKREHVKSSCEYCGPCNVVGCMKKPDGFKCNCLQCDKVRKDKEQQKLDNWQNKIHDKISVEPNFPNDDIIDIYLCGDHRRFTENDVTCLSWGRPNTEMLVDFLSFHQLWEPSYIRQRMLPMLSTIYLRKMAANPEKALLYDQYEFDSIQRIKVRYGHESYVIKWKKATQAVSSNSHANTMEDLNSQQEDIVEIDDSVDQLEEDNGPHSYVDGGCWFLLTDENVDLVCGAFPDAVDRFLKEKELKESKRKKGSGSSGKSESVKSTGIQLNITEFYRSSKVQFPATAGEEQSDSLKDQDGAASKGKRKISSPNLPKSVRRRLLFQ